MDVFVYEIRDSIGKAVLKGVTDTVEFISWKRKFYSSDEFELLMPCTENNSRLFTSGSIVEIPDRYAGFITKINCFEKNKLYYIRAEGCSFEGMLKRRIMLDYTEEDSVMTILNKNAGTAADEIRKFPAAVFDFSVDCQGTANSSYKYKSLSAYVNAVGKLNGFGVCSELVHEGCEAYIRMFLRYGKDRTADQTENPQAVFSDVYENMHDVEYVYNENGAMTGAFVYSEGKQMGEYFIAPWRKMYGDDTSGYERSEKAFEIEPQIVYTSYFDGQKYIYVPKLDTEASEKYGSWIHNSQYEKFRDYFNIVLQPDVNYTKIFDTGDKITVYCQKLNRRIDDVVCSVNEIYSKGSFRAEVQVGDNSD